MIFRLICISKKAGVNKRAVISAVVKRHHGYQGSFVKFILKHKKKLLVTELQQSKIQWKKPYWFYVKLTGVIF